MRFSAPLALIATVVAVTLTTIIVGSAGGATNTVLPTSFKGMYNATAGETITAAGPLSDVSIRVSVSGVTIRGVSFLNATRDRSRPATIDGSGSTNLRIENVAIRGDGTQQNQAIYVQGGTGLVISGGSCTDPGNDRYFDHCAYLNNTKNFRIENWTARAAHGAAVHVYSGGATGTVNNSDLGRSAWNIVVWGSGNDVTVTGSKLHDAVKVENGRGYAAEAVTGKLTISGTCTANAATVGNVAGHPGWNTQGGGTIVDGGGNTFGAACAAAPPPPPPPPTAGGKCDFTVLDQRIAAIADATTRSAFQEIRRHLALAENC